MIGRNLTTLVIGVVMEHVKTLKMYEDLVDAGMPESQAKATVYALDTAFDGVVTVKDLEILKTDLKVFFSLEIVAVVIFIISVPTLMNFIKKSYKWNV